MSTGNAPYYMGIDVGTSETKGLLIDRNCRIVLQSSIKHSMEHPKPGQISMTQNVSGGMTSALLLTP